MEKKNLFILILIVVLLTLMSITLICCTTFKPIWEKELPAECNMTLNVYKMYYKTEDKSAIVPMTEACVKKLHRQSCQAEIFGADKDGNPNPVLYDDSKLYRNYTQCLSELK
jgi:hypothetical protein